VWETILDPKGTSGVRVWMVMVNAEGVYWVMVAVSCAMDGLRIAVFGIRKDVLRVVLRKLDSVGGVLLGAVVVGGGGGAGSPM